MGSPCVPWNLLSACMATPSSKLHNTSTASSTPTMDCNYSCSPCYTNTRRHTFFFSVSTMLIRTLLLNFWLFVLLCTFLPDLTHKVVNCYLLTSALKKLMGSAVRFQTPSYITIITVRDPVLNTLFSTRQCWTSLGIDSNQDGVYHVSLDLV